MRPAVRSAAAAVRPVMAGTGRRSRDLTILGWHRIDAQGGGLGTAVEVFEQQLDHLEAWGATVLPLDEAVSSIQAGTLPPRAVAITFDDGYASVVETAWGMLRRRNMPATLFVVSDYLDAAKRFPWDAGANSSDHVRLVDRPNLLEAVDEGLDVGSHTVSHPWLPRLLPPDLRRELADSRHVLEDLLQRPVTSLAYPSGGWNSAVRDAAMAAGYHVGLTVDRGRSSPSRDPLSLRRSIVPDTVDDLALVLDGAYTWLRPFDTWRRRKGPPW